MTQSTPSYLRLHTAESRETATSANRPSLPLIKQFWLDFSAATGWTARAGRRGIQLRSNVGGTESREDDLGVDLPAMSRVAAEQLARTAGRMAEQLRKMEARLHSSEAQLAAGEVESLVPDPRFPQPDPQPLEQRLQQILNWAMVASGTEAAGLYMIDDQTSRLKLRSCAGLDPAALADPPRQLRGSLADLQALVGSVVDVESPAESTDAPRGDQDRAALVAAVSVGETPVGTLWFWGAIDQRFSERERSSIQLAAGLVARELANDTICRRSRKATAAIQPLRPAAHWQQRQQPLRHDLDRRWKVTGWLESPAALASSWYHWDVLPNGMLAFVLAEAAGEGYERALIAATARAAWQSHSGYRHDPAQLVRRISDTLWGTNSGEQQVSIAYVQLDPETGEGQLASAGEISGLIASPLGVRPVISAHQPLGSEIDPQPFVRSFRLQTSETLLAYTPGLVRAAGCPEDANHLTQLQVADLIRGGDVWDVEEMTARLRRAAAELGPAESDRAALAVARLPAEPRDERDPLTHVPLTDVTPT